MTFNFKFAFHNSQVVMVSLTVGCSGRDVVVSAGWGSKVYIKH